MSLKGDSPAFHGGFARRGNISIYLKLQENRDSWYPDMWRPIPARRSGRALPRAREVYVAAEQRHLVILGVAVSTEALATFEYTSVQSFHTLRTPALYQI